VGGAKPLQINLFIEFSIATRHPNRSRKKTLQNEKREGASMGGGRTAKEGGREKTILSWQENELRLRQGCDIEKQVKPGRAMQKNRPARGKCSRRLRPDHEVCWKADPERKAEKKVLRKEERLRKPEATYRGSTSAILITGSGERKQSKKANGESQKWRKGLRGSKEKDLPEAAANRLKLILPPSLRAKGSYGPTRSPWWGKG